MPGIDSSRQFVPLKIAVLTMSDTRALEDDKSGATLVERIAKIGTSAIQTRATAGVAEGTYVFCLPGSPGACRDAWDEILVHQLDYRYRPCNFVELMPRLDEHLRRPKAKGATA